MQETANGPQGIQHDHHSPVTQDNVPAIRHNRIRYWSKLPESRHFAFESRGQEQISRALFYPMEA